jgi:hypothetical protein
MKQITSTLILYLFALSALGQATYKGIPLIKARSVSADYKIGNDWVKGSWTISPQNKADTLLITCHSDYESFAFYTDRERIDFQLSPNQIHTFYVTVNDTAFALTVIRGIKPNYHTLQFDKISKNSNLQFWYEQNNNNEYLNLLRSKYPIDRLVKNLKTDTEKTLCVMNWVHNQWKHNGNNEPQKNDAISILQEVKEGKNFRCVEYATVTTTCLNSIGLKARVLGLKTKDVETTPYGAGHVLLEVFLNDLNKWIVIDPQWNAMPLLNNLPLNAVEFQIAITEDYNRLEIRSWSGLSKRIYADWIYPYLYYFDISFDNREGKGAKENKVNRKKSLMLVPFGAINPSVFQIKHKIDDCLYTNSLIDFYGSPANYKN